MYKNEYVKLKNGIFKLISNMTFSIGKRNFWLKILPLDGAHLGKKTSCFVGPIGRT